MTVKNGSSFIAAFLILLSLNPFNSKAQEGSDEINSIHGNFQVDAQYYNYDSLIGAPKVPEKMLSNAFGNLNYQRGKFSAGLRYEAYNSVMQGFDARYKGQGITNRFARYQDKLVDITIGNIYEQFGSGLLFRTYYEPGLLYDNSLDGIRVISNPYKGLTLKGLVGKQRSFFTVGPGTVRGFDGELNINEALDSLASNIKTKFIIGGTFVSKFQSDQDPNLVLPENVGSYGGRLNVIHEGFNVFAEYVMKENDPSAANKTTANGKTYYSYKNGDAFFLSSSYATEGFSVLFQAKRIDNMSYRSDRDASLQNLMSNYLPATTKQHTYLMPAFNPYATQPLGELGGMIEIAYKAKKGSLLGGKYGMDITINYSHASGLKQYGVNDSTTSMTLYKTKWDLAELNNGVHHIDSIPVDNNGTITYKKETVRNFYAQRYYQDFFIEVSKKFNKKVKGNFMYAHQFYNKNIVQFGSKFAGYDNIFADIFIADITWKYKTGAAIRFESQALITNNSSNPNAGSWTTNLIEWTPSTHFFIAVLDQINFDNPDKANITAIVNKNSPLLSAIADMGMKGLSGDLNLHYGLITAGYSTGPHRISFSYGKQRAGIFCVGGVCRNVPASNGFAISITSSF